MGAKVSKIASYKVATQCTIAFSSLIRYYKKVAKLYRPHENYDDAMNCLYMVFCRIVCVGNLVRCMYPLDWQEFTEGMRYIDEQYMCAIKSIDCIHPIMRNMHRLYRKNATQLVKTMRMHIKDLMLTELEVRMNGNG